MKVILLERVGRIGQIGDQVNVRDGFARNFLLPQGKALRATEANRARFETERAEIEKRNQERRDAAAGIAAGLNGATVVMIRQASESGQLYGSVSTRDVAEALGTAGHTVARGQVSLTDPIKTVGMHVVPLHLHAEVDVTVNVNVARSEDEAERQARGEDLTVQSFEEEEEAEAVFETEAPEDTEAGEAGDEPVVGDDAEIAATE